MTEAALQEAREEEGKLRTREEQWVAAAHSRDTELQFLRGQAAQAGLPPYSSSQLGDRVCTPLLASAAGRLCSVGSLALRRLAAQDGLFPCDGSQLGDRVRTP